MPSFEDKIDGSEKSSIASDNCKNCGKQYSATLLHRCFVKQLVSDIAQSNDAAQSALMLITQRIVKRQRSKNDKHLTQVVFSSETRSNVGIVHFEHN